MTAKRSTVPRRYRAPEGPNGASVVTSIRNAEIAVLLGADLEVSANVEAGWDGLLKYAKPTAKASVVKVPHHGSPGAHHDAVWTELSEDEVVAIVTPWARGGRYLPTQEDLARLRSSASRVYLTATPSLARARKDAELERLIRRLHGERLEELRGWGHVRARRRLDEETWRIELAGDAIVVDP